MFIRYQCIFIQVTLSQLYNWEFCNVGEKNRQHLLVIVQ